MNEDLKVINLKFSLNFHLTQIEIQKHYLLFFLLFYKMKNKIVVVCQAFSFFRHWSKQASCFHQVNRIEYRLNSLSRDFVFGTNLTKSNLVITISS